MKPAQRKFLLEMALRRTKPGSGSLLSEMHEESGTYGIKPDLPPLDNLRYVVVGGLATALYMPERATLDVDILIARSDLPMAEKLLIKAECRRLGPLSVGDSTWSMRDGRALDVLALDQPWVEAALASPVWGLNNTPFAALSYLILMKLESGRLQDLADISRMLGCANAEQIGKVRSRTARFRPQDTEDLESMLKLGKMEHDRT